LKKPSEAHRTPILSEAQQKILAHLNQPLTASQISRKTDLPRDVCRDVLRKLAKRDWVRCLNTDARRSRLYWLTPPGQADQRRLFLETGKQQPECHFPSIDWSLYGWVCFSHRSVIIKTLTEPLQPAAIKRRARIQQSTLRMSANNARDILRLFTARGLVQPVRVRKKVHLRYELTSTGRQFQQLLWRAEALA